MAGKTASQIWSSVLVNAIYAMKNYPVMLINNLLAPLSFLIVITFVSRGSLLGLAIEGAFIMTMVSSGLGLQGDLSHLKNDLKVQEMVVASPTSASVYLVGMALSELVYALPSLVILTILAIFFLPLTLAGTLALIGAVSLIFLVAIALGFFFSTLTSDIIESWAFSGMLSILLSTLPPVYYPINYIPMPWTYLAFLSPTTYAAEIAQSSAGFLSLSSLNVVLDWVVLISLTVIVLYIAVRRSRWVSV